VILNIILTNARFFNTAVFSKKIIIKIPKRMKKTALITGILGQDGAYLAKLLLEKDYTVYGLIRRYTNPNFGNTDYLGVTKKIEFLTGDMTDESSLMNVIKVIQPEEVLFEVSKLVGNKQLTAQDIVGKISSADLQKYDEKLKMTPREYLKKVTEAMKTHKDKKKEIMKAFSEDLPEIYKLVK